ncbi:hypothetical protein ACFV5G_03975 [Streptomyces sp. NPDC059766]|uniref:hypothetical protein n=1 Tax=Streptomyces sp. NPDC059766 TaxID=3346940 RepID=UPI003662A5B4
MARILPILRVVNTPFVEDLEAVVAGCGSGIGNAVDSLRNWRTELAGSVDILLPSYYQATAVSVGLLIADSDSLEPSERFMKVNASVGNLWNCCDHIVHRAGGFQAVEFRGLKSTLRGVENMWFDRDVELLSSPVNPGEILEARLREISDKSLARNLIAAGIARCAEWEVN